MTAPRQNGLYLSLVFVVSGLAQLSYSQLKSEWIDFRSGEQHYQRHQYQEAILCYEQALQKGATPPCLFLHLADSYVAEGHFTQAIPLYREFLTLYPHNEAARLSFAKALVWSGDWHEAEKELTHILESLGNYTQTTSKMVW